MEELMSTISSPSTSSSGNHHIHGITLANESGYQNSEIVIKLPHLLKHTLITLKEHHTPKEKQNYQ